MLTDDLITRYRTRRLDRPSVQKGLIMIGDTSIWIDVKLVNETDKAMLFVTDDGEKWIPKSCIGAKRREPGGAIIRIEVSEWFAKKEGLYDGKDEG